MVDKTGFYGVTVTDKYGCVSSDEFVIESIKPLPTVSLSGAPTICMEDTLWLDAGNFTKLKWQDGSTDRLYPASETGTYTVTVTNNQGCINSGSFHLYVQQPFNEPLCMATVSENGENIVVAWERTKGQGTDYYELFKVAYGDTVLVAKRPFDSLSVVVDTAAKINQQAYRYMLKTTDTCGHTTEYSPFHQTIYLTARPELNSGGVALDWTSYEGQDHDGYLIYEVKDGVKTEIGNASAFENGYTVEKHTSGSKYRVGVKFPTCTPTTLKSESGPFSQSMSNLSEAIILGHNNDLLVSVVYPNQNDGLFGVFFQSASSANLDIQIVNANGILCKQFCQQVTGNGLFSVDIRELPAATYQLHISNGDTKRIVSIVKH